jgi:hypothetical protein
MQKSIPSIPKAPEMPGSIIEQMKIIDPLTNPTAHGGNASDAFHLLDLGSSATL